ncbi:hypothetical protein [Rhizobium sp.]
MTAHASHDNPAQVTRPALHDAFQRAKNSPAKFSCVQPLRESRPSRNIFMTNPAVPILYLRQPAGKQPGVRMRIAFMLMPAFLVIATPLAAQPVSPHEKISEIYKIIRICPALKVDRKALDRYAMLNGLDLTPGSRADRWFLRRADYDLRKVASLNNGYLCRQGMTKYGPQGAVAKGLMLTN